MSDQDKAWLRHIGQTICDEWVRSQRRYSFDAGFSAGTESQAARIKELEAMVQHEWASVGLCIISIDRLQELESSLAAAVAEREAAERDAGRWNDCVANGFPVCAKPVRTSHPEYWYCVRGGISYSGNSPSAAIDAAKEQP